MTKTIYLYKKLYLKINKKRRVDMSREAYSPSLATHNTQINYQPIHAKVIPKGEHALVAVSPCNSYFSIKNMEALFNWTHENFHDFNVFITDGASVFNFIALGYDKKLALKKTKKNDSGLKCKVIRSLTNIGFSTDDSRKKILFLSHLSKTDRYIKMYNYYMHIFQSNTSFRNDCLGATKTMLLERMEDVSDDAANLAVKYLLAELPLWLDSPSVLGIESSSIIYKELSFFWERICYHHKLLAPKQEICIKCVE
jgi:cyclo(L-tyrosyl-L-tyrosyl) synthase